MPDREHDLAESLVPQLPQHGLEDRQAADRDEGLGQHRRVGASRVPLPPARITAFMTRS